MPQREPRRIARVREGKKSTARRYRQRRGLAALAVVVLLLAGAVWLYNSDLVPIRTVHVSGTRHLTRGEVVRLSGVRLGKTSLLKLPSRDISIGVKRNSWVKSVALSRLWVEKGLEIQVTERRPLVVVRSGQTFLAIDDDSVVVEELVDLTGVRWPEVTGVDLAGVKAGTKVRSKALAAALRCLSSLDSDVRKTVNGVSAAGPDEITFYSNLAGEIVFGGPTQLALKNRVIDKVLADQPGRLSSLDVRVPTNPVVRPFGR